MPIRLREDIARLAAGQIDLPAEYGNASLDRQTLAPWVPIDLLFRDELKGRQRLKSWRELNDQLPS